MRRFNYTSYVTPDDPKRQRTELYGKYRTEAKSLQEVAEGFLADLDDATLLNVEGSIDSQDLAQNTLRFTFSFIEPYPCTTLVEMQEVSEGPLHELTQEGFVAWAEDRVRSEPAVDGKPNTVEWELAQVLHRLHTDQLQEEKASDLRAWMSDVLWSGQKGYAEMSRAELLQELQSELIDLAGDSFDTIEDAVE